MIPLEYLSLEWKPMGMREYRVQPQLQTDHVGSR